MINSRIDSGSGLRPLTPRSIVLSVLLGQHPPEMSIGRLLEFTSVFDIADGTVRTAMSRLVAAGDLVADDGVYRLSTRLATRQAEQDAGRATAPATWDGQWWFAFTLSERRSVAERREFRSRASGARLGELRPDLWLRPANLELSRPIPGTALTRGPLLDADPATMVDRLWPLDELDQTAGELIAPLDDAIEALAARTPDRHLPPAFSALAAAQRFLRTEPQLPIELSERRNADLLRQRYTTAARAFQRALDRFFAQRERLAR